MPRSQMSLERGAQKAVQHQKDINNCRYSINVSVTSNSQHCCIDPWRSISTTLVTFVIVHQHHHHHATPMKTLPFSPSLLWRLVVKFVHIFHVSHVSYIFMPKKLLVSLLAWLRAGLFVSPQTRVWWHKLVNSQYFEASASHGKLIVRN